MINKTNGNDITLYRVWLVLSRTGGSGDFTARTGRFMIIKQ